MTGNSRTDRQERIPNWKQHKLSEATVAIVGDDTLSNFVAVGLAGLGIGELKFYGNKSSKDVQPGEFLNFNLKKGEKVKGLEEMVKEIMPGGEAKAIIWEFFDSTDPLILRKPSVIVNTLNDPKVSYFLTLYANFERIPLINAYSSEFKGKIMNFDPRSDKLLIDYKGEVLVLDKTTEKLLHDDAKITNLGCYMSERFKGKAQDSITSSVIAGLIVDQVRKVVMPIEPGDSLSKQPINYNLLSSSRMSQNDDIKEYSFNKDIKAIIVGAGSLGNPLSTNLTLKGIKELLIIDDDTVEEANLNRQFGFCLYEKQFGQSVIGKSKSEALAAVLKKINPEIKIDYVKGKFTSDFDTKGKKYDVIFDCVDKFTSREAIHDYSLKTGITIISGGTDFKSGRVNVVVPDKTYCFDHQINIRAAAANQRERESHSCIAEPDPSVITSNLIIGSMMAGECTRIFGKDKETNIPVEPLHGSIEFQSDVERIIQYTASNKGSCNCYNQQVTKDVK